MTIKLEPRKCYTIAGATGSGKIHRNLYFYADGSATVDGKKIVGRKRVKVDASADLRLEAGDEPVGVLVLQGRDLEEPVMQHGPFVGCTSADIRKAFTDYQQTGFGGWPWPDVGVVHAREEQRAGRFPDGTKENAAAARDEANPIRRPAGSYGIFRVTTAQNYNLKLVGQARLVDEALGHAHDRDERRHPLVAEQRLELRVPQDLRVLHV